MACCELIDYDERPESMIELYEYLAVTQDDIAEAKDIIPPDQLAQVEEGDLLVVYIVDNRIEGVMGLLTVWGNKSMACIDTGNGTVRGDWDLNKRLLLTADFEEAKDCDDKVVRGRIAYNCHGIRGIYSGGIFYTVREPILDVEPGKDKGADTRPYILCNNEESHAVHICQLRNKAGATEIKNLAKDPIVSCLLCETLANSADHVCSPVEYD